MQTRKRRILSVSILGPAVAVLLMLSATATPDNLFLLGEYEEIYRPDFAIELGRHDTPNWRVPVFLPHGEPDPFLAVDVQPDGVHIESVDERPSDDEGHRTGILSSTFPVGDGFEATVHIDVRALDEDWASTIGTTSVLRGRVTPRSGGTRCGFSTTHRPGPLPRTST